MMHSTVAPLPGLMNPRETGITRERLILPSKAEDDLQQVEWQVDELIGTIRDRYGSRRPTTMADYTALESEIEWLRREIVENARDAAEAALAG